MHYSKILAGLTKIIAKEVELNFDELLADSEYKSVHRSRIEGYIKDGDNDEFVQRCYAMLLGRPADRGGFACWITALEDGMSRKDVVENIKASEEYTANNTDIPKKQEAFLDHPELPAAAELSGIYIDITNFVTTKLNTGIQRVIAEVCSRLAPNKQYHFVVYSKQRESFFILDRNSVSHFFKDPHNCVPLPIAAAQVCDFGYGCTFFDMDSSWNTPHKRSYIYKEFSAQGTKIVSYLYDVIPILKPKAMTLGTLKNFTINTAAVLRYSNLIITDSLSTENDLFDIRSEIGCEEAPTLVTGLGVRPYTASDFIPDISLEIPTQKYILFVGTLEPRKRQDLVLDAFLEIQKTHKDLSLVFIGKVGWGRASLNEKIQNNRDNNVRFYSGITDENLRRLYTNAFLNIYISDYEGYGLPVAEGLAAGQITITSLNSSIYEAGRDFADYIKYDSSAEIAHHIKGYLENTELYEAKKNHIKNNYVPLSWDLVSERIDNAIAGLAEQSILTKNQQFEKIQHVSISIRPDVFEKRIRLQEKYGCCASEFVVVTRSDMINTFQNIRSKTPITVIDESVLINRDKNTDFFGLDHVEKNWFLRSGLTELDEIDEQFVMLDDDSFPMGYESIDRFIDSKGRYKAYYFHNLLTWHNHGTSFDMGMQRAKRNAWAFGTEFRAYGSHCSQIINKSMFKEAIVFSQTDGMEPSPTEWEAYFNYAISFYPHLFHKTKARVLNWPAHPASWLPEVEAYEYQTENYYEDLYKKGSLFSNVNIEDQKKKVEIKNKITRAYQATVNENIKLHDVIGAFGLTHNLCKFEHPDGAVVYLSHIPKYVKLRPSTRLHIAINYKGLNTQSSANDDNLHIHLRDTASEKNISSKKLTFANRENSYQETVFMMPIIVPATGLGKSYELILSGDSAEFSSADEPCKIFVEGC
jgi:glycosyltransferase involved in cell wall biosynthesis